MYKVLDDPTYKGNPVEILYFIQEMLGDYDSRRGREQYPILEDMEPDPPLFSEDAGFCTAALTTPEVPNTEVLDSFDSSAYLQYMMVGEFNDSVADFL